MERRSFSMTDNKVPVSGFGKIAFGPHTKNTGPQIISRSVISGIDNKSDNLRLPVANSKSPLLLPNLTNEPVSSIPKDRKTHISLSPTQLSTENLNGYSNNLCQDSPSFCMANPDISYWNNSKKNETADFEQNFSLSMEIEKYNEYSNSSIQTLNTPIDGKDTRKIPKLHVPISSSYGTNSSNKILLLKSSKSVGDNDFNGHLFSRSVGYSQNETEWNDGESGKINYNHPITSFIGSNLLGKRSIDQNDKGRIHESSSIIPIKDDIHRSNHPLDNNHINIIPLGPDGMGITDENQLYLELMGENIGNIKILKYIFSLCQQSFKYDKWYLDQSLNQIWLLCYEELEELFYGLKYNNISNLREEIGDVLLNLFLFMTKAEKEGIVNMETIFKIMVSKLNSRAPHILKREMIDNQESQKIWEHGKVNSGYIGSGSKGKLTMNIFNEGPGIAKYRGAFINTTPRKKDKKSGKYNSNGHDNLDTGWVDYVLSRFREPITNSIIEESVLLINEIKRMPNLKRIVFIGTDPILLPITNLDIPIIFIESNHDIAERWNQLSTTKCSNINIIEVIGPNTLVIVWGNMISKTGWEDRKDILSQLRKIPKGTLIWCLYQNAQYTLLNQPDLLLTKSKHNIVECLNGKGYLTVNMPGHRVEIAIITPKAAQDEFRQFFHYTSYFPFLNINNDPSSIISPFFLIQGIR